MIIDRLEIAAFDVPSSKVHDRGPLSSRRLWNSPEHVIGRGLYRRSLQKLCSGQIIVLRHVNAKRSTIAGGRLDKRQNATLNLKWPATAIILVRHAPKGLGFDPVQLAPEDARINGLLYSGIVLELHLEQLVAILQWIDVLETQEYGRPYPLRWTDTVIELDLLLIKTLRRGLALMQLWWVVLSWDLVCLLVSWAGRGCVGAGKLRFQSFKNIIICRLELLWRRREITSPTMGVTSKIVVPVLLE